MKAKLARVNKKDRCPICGSDTWCLYGSTVVICMRVQSNHTKHFSSGEIGWLHSLGDPLPHYKPPEREELPPLDCYQLLNDWAEDSGRSVHLLAARLGVTDNALCRLGCVWATPHRAWAFPMRNGDGKVVGIRLRSDSGEKWAVKGSKQGLFEPYGQNLQAFMADHLFIVEGPTDTAAALSIGLNAVGRPSCSGGLEDLRVLCRRLKIRKAVIISDNDEVGRRGAAMLTDALVIPRATIILPAKDMREFINYGGDAQLIQQLVAAVLWRQGIYQQAKEDHGQRHD